jgi:hypothetical protein
MATSAMSSCDAMATGNSSRGNKAIDKISREFKIINGLKLMNEAINLSEYPSNFPIKTKEKLEAWKLTRFKELEVELKEASADAKSHCRVEDCKYETNGFGGFCHLHQSIARTVTTLVNARLCKNDDCTNKLHVTGDNKICDTCEKGDLKISTNGAPLMSNEEIQTMVKKDFEPVLSFIADYKRENPQHAKTITAYCGQTVRGFYKERLGEHAKNPERNAWFKTLVLRTLGDVYNANKYKYESIVYMCEIFGKEHILNKMSGGGNHV